MALKCAFPYMLSYSFHSGEIIRCAVRVKFTA